MKEITAYKLENGEILEDPQAAENREKYISVYEALQKLCDERGYRKIASFIMDNRYEIKETLNKLPEPPKEQ